MSKKLKIGITCYPTFGGSGVIATELGLAMADLGHEVHFITSRMPVRLQSHPLADVSFHEVNTYTYALFQHSPYDLALASKMAEVVETHELDLLHVHYAIPHAVSAHLAREMLGGGVKVVTTLHGTDITLVGNDPSLYKITKFAIDQSDAVTAVSDWLRAETEREFKPQVPVQVVRNFVDTSEFTPRSHEALPLKRHCSGEYPQLIHISNYRPVKRGPDAIEIFNLVLKQHDARLLMVGDGPDLSTAVQRARKLGIFDRVSFLGNREEVACLLAASDVALVPSESESFGLSALEAMACGCAVVTSDIGGLPELVREGVDGYLCPVGDVDAMAGRVNDLLKDTARLEEIKRNGRQRAVEEYDISHVLPEYLKVYEQVLRRSDTTVRSATA
ncbi:MAG: N-acetyl-alpha-D-glucosaminyl L-malate synthase BshA [bacterium]|nr:N-acetyl-alpha-D-glucosaminyl L-malate synthase BshA [bacterium]